MAILESVTYIPNLSVLGCLHFLLVLIDGSYLKDTNQIFFVYIYGT